MISFLVLQLVVMSLVVFAVHFMKYWCLMIIPTVMSQEMNVKEQDLTTYILFSYLAYFYGMMLGCFLWNKLQNFLPPTIVLLLSLLMMGSTLFMQSVYGNVNAYIFFRFLNGIASNINNFGKSFVHEYIGREHRKSAFFCEAGSSIMGSLTAPLAGLLLYQRTKSFLIVCFVIAVMVFVIAFFNFITFSEKIKKNRKKSLIGSSDSDNPNSFKRRVSTAPPGLKAMFSYCLISNIVARYLIIIFIINSACFSADIVISTLFLTTKSSDDDIQLSKASLSSLNAFSAIASIFMLVYIKNNIPMKMKYDNFLKTILCLSVFLVLMTPFLKEFLKMKIFGRFSQEIILIIYGCKFFFGYHLYSNLLTYFINLSIHKIYRRQLNLILNVVKTLCSGLLFNFLMIVFKETYNWDVLVEHAPLNACFSFWIIAGLQLCALVLFQIFYFPPPRKSMLM